MIYAHHLLMYFIFLQQFAIASNGKNLLNILKPIKSH